MFRLALHDGPKWKVTMTLKRILPGSLFCICSLLLSNCSGLELASIRATKAVTIDALTSDWPDSGWAEKDGLRFAVMNDDEQVYVVLAVLKPELRRQIMFRGLTVWFDPLARGKKTIGVRYPLGMTRVSRQPGEGDPLAQTGQSQLAFEYISPLEGVPLIAAGGISLRINNERESLVYELRIPLKSSSDKTYSIESTPGTRISVGFEIGGLEGTGEAPGGAGGGGRGRCRVSAGGAPARGTITPMEPLEVWAAIRLAGASTQ